MTVEDARYSYSSDKNRLLLLALAEAWGSNCYWCRKPKTFRDLQIDHILPRNPRGGRVPEVDVDATANLAPICGSCNQEKSNGEFEDAPRFDAARKRAAELVPQVERNLVRFRKDASVVKALLAVTAADLESDDVAESVESFGALIMPVFRERFPQVLDAPYTKDYTVERPPMELHGQRIRLPEERSVVELDAQSRRALVILEDVLEISMEDAFDEVRAHFGGDIDEQVKEWLRSAEMHQYRRASLYERPRANTIGVYVHELRHAEAEVTLTGELDGSFAADVEDYEPDPGHDWSWDRRAEFDFAGEFSITMSREGITDAWVSLGEPEENHWRTPSLRYDD